MSNYKVVKIWARYSGRNIEGFKSLPREWPALHKKKPTSNRAKDRTDRLLKQYLLWFPYGVRVRFDATDLKFLPPRGYVMATKSSLPSTPKYTADPNQHWIMLYNRFSLRRDRAPIKMVKKQ